MLIILAVLKYSTQNKRLLFKHTHPTIILSSSYDQIYAHTTNSTNSIKKIQKVEKVPFGRCMGCPRREVRMEWAYEMKQNKNQQKRKKTN